MKELVVCIKFKRRNVKNVEKIKYIQKLFFEKDIYAFNIQKINISEVGKSVELGKMKPYQYSVEELETPYKVELNSTKEQEVPYMTRETPVYLAPVELYVTCYYDKHKTVWSATNIPEEEHVSVAQYFNEREFIDYHNEKDVLINGKQFRLISYTEFTFEKEDADIARAVGNYLSSDSFDIEQKIKWGKNSQVQNDLRRIADIIENIDKGERM